MQSLKKSWEWIPRTKQLSFLDPNWGKNDPFCNNRSFFQKLGTIIFFKHNNVTLCKISKDFLGCIMRKAVYRPTNNFDLFIDGLGHKHTI